MPTIMDYYNSGTTALNNQIQTQYLPDKLRLANQYQGLVNSYYGPAEEADINYKNTESKFTPLKYGIEAENAIRNNSRFGGAYQYLKSISDLPAPMREVYLTDPDNYNQFMGTIQMLKQGGSANQGGPKILTPNFLKQFNMGNDILGGGLSGGIMPNTASDDTLSSSPIPGTPSNNQSPMDMSVPSIPSIPSIGAASPPPSSMNGGLGNAINNDVSSGNDNQQNIPSSLPAQSVSDNPSLPMSGGQPQIDPTKVDMNQAQTISDNATNPELTSKEKTYLAQQTIANRAIAGTVATNRAMGAITLMKFIQDNRDVFAKRLESAAKYAGALGQGQAAIDKLKKESPQSYIDYDWVMHDFIPNLSNNVKVMEKLASSDQQRKALNDMTGAAYKWDLDPKSAIKYLNMNFDMFERQGRATLAAAQPRFPGALEKLNGIKPSTGDYIDTNKNGASSQNEMPGKVKIQDANGRTGWIPKENLQKALKISGVKQVQ